MILYSNIISLNVNDDGTMDVQCSVGYVQSGTAVNFGVHLTITPPTLLTAALFNLAVQTAVSNYTDANFGTSTTATDVILFSGVTSV